MSWNGKKLKDARARLGLSQGAFAVRIGFGVTSLRNWETGRATPAFEAIVAICKITGKPIEHFNAGGS